MEALYIVLGWILGLLSPPLADLIQKPYRRKKVRESLFIEMEELSRRLAANTYLIYDQQGRIDREFLDWIKPVMGSYKRRHSKKPLAEQTDQLLALTDDQIRMLFQPSKNDREHYTLKK